MAVQRIGADRRRAMIGEMLPRSPEFLARRAAHTADPQEPTERRTLDPEEVTPPCVVRLTCPTHDVLVRRHVECRHDLRELVDEVADAHAAPYGGQCGMSLQIWFGEDA